MKKIISIALLTIFCVFTAYTQADNQNAAKTLPSVKVKDLKGKMVDTKTFNNDGKPIVISFWATWCKPCVLEMKTIAAVYPKWQKETGVKLIGISIDDSRSTGKVPALVKSNNWDYEIYCDPNADFKRAMNVVDVPQTFLLNGKGEIVWSHNSYAAGDEEILYNEIKKLVAPSKDAK